MTNPQRRTRHLATSIQKHQNVAQSQDVDGMDGRGTSSLAGSAKSIELQRDRRCQNPMDTPPEKLKPEQMPAFPLHSGDVWGGMTLRDYFAAKAMVALIYDGIDAKKGFAKAAADAYVVADAMLKARTPSPT